MEISNTPASCMAWTKRTCAKAPELQLVVMMLKPATANARSRAFMQRNIFQYSPKARLVASKKDSSSSSDSAPGPRQTLFGSGDLVQARFRSDSVRVLRLIEVRHQYG